MSDDCIFCKIVAGDIPSNKVFESDTVLAFHDINPVKQVHVLVIPKQHIPDPSSLDESTAPVMADMFLAIKAVAAQLGVDESGYRLVINQGQHGGQDIFHMHIHMLGGEKLGWPPG